MEEIAIQLQQMKKESQYVQMEKLYLSMFGNQKLTQARRFEAGVNVFQIDAFYKPKSKVEVLLEDILNLQPPQETDEISSDFIRSSILNLADKFFKQVSMKQSLSSLDFLKNLEDVEEFKKYSKLYILTW